MLVSPCTAVCLHSHVHPFCTRAGTHSIADEFCRFGDTLVRQCMRLEKQLALCHPAIALKPTSAELKQIIRGLA